MAAASEQLLIAPTIEGERIVLELSRHSTRLAFTLQEWAALRRAGDDLAEVIRSRSTPDAEGR